MRNALVGFLSSIFLLCAPTATHSQENLTPSQVVAAMRAHAVLATSQSWPKLTTRQIIKWPLKGVKLIPWHDKAFHISGMLKKAGEKFPQHLFGVGRSVSYGLSKRAANVISVSTCTKAMSVEVFQKGTGFNSQLTVFVDGERINKKPIQHPSDGGFYLTRIDFGNQLMHCYKFLFNNAHFGGIFLKDGEVASPPKRKHKFRAMFIGNSYTESGQSWASYAARLLDWDDAWISGVGATGYINAPKPKLNYGQRLESDVIAYQPNVIVIAGGINDSGYPTDKLNKAASKLFSKIQKRLPNTIVFVLGPWNPRTAINPAVNEAIKKAASGRPNFYWVPNYDDNWITGTGHQGALKGNGNSDFIIGSDGTHPTAKGHQYIAQRFADHVRKVLGVTVK